MMNRVDFVLALSAILAACAHPQPVATAAPTPLAAPCLGPVFLPSELGYAWGSEAERALDAAHQGVLRWAAVSGLAACREGATLPPGLELRAGIRAALAASGGAVVDISLLLYRRGTLDGKTEFVAEVGADAVRWYQLPGRLTALYQSLLAKARVPGAPGP